jgi:acetolactate synthase small subunit
LFEAKRQANDDAKLQDQTGVNANNKKTLTEQEEIRIEKTKSEIANEAENMDLTNELRKKQLDIKDENLGEEFTADRAAIKTINNNVKNKTTIREAIEAGTNCTKRNS